MAHGQRLYHDVWEQRPPGIYWIYLAGFRVFGWTPAAVAWLDILASAATCLLLAAIVRPLSSTRTAMIAAALYAWLTMPAWLARSRRIPRAERVRDVHRAHRRILRLERCPRPAGEFCRGGTGDGTRSRCRCGAEAECGFVLSRTAAVGSRVRPSSRHAAAACSGGCGSCGPAGRGVDLAVASRPASRCTGRGRRLQSLLRWPGIQRDRLCARFCESRVAPDQDRSALALWHHRVVRRVGGAGTAAEYPPLRHWRWCGVPRPSRSSW